jgi:hypothetical protein
MMASVVSNTPALPRLRRALIPRPQAGGGHFNDPRAFDPFLSERGKVGAGAADTPRKGTA